MFWVFFKCVVRKTGFELVHTYVCKVDTVHRDGITSFSSGVFHYIYCSESIG